MIKGFLTAITGVVFLGTACDMLIPEGNLKKYYKLAIGFVVMCVLIKPLSGVIDFKLFEFTPIDEMSEEEILAQSEAYILKIHEENIKEYVLSLCKNATEVFVQVHNDGNVRSIRIKSENISNDIIEKIKRETGCEDVSVIEDENN